jgi:hypothetical protein
MILLLAVVSCSSPAPERPNAAELCVGMRPCYEDDLASTCLVVACGAIVGSEDCTAGPTHMALATTDETGLTRAQITCEDLGGVWHASAPDECPDLSSPSGGAFQMEVACLFD